MAGRGRLLEKMKRQNFSVTLRNDRKFSQDSRLLKPALAHWRQAKRQKWFKHSSTEIGGRTWRKGRCL